MQVTARSINKRHFIDWQRATAPVAIEPVEIVPGKGAGLLQFGMTHRQSRATVGVPTMSWTDEEGDRRELYTSSGLVLAFLAQEDFTLICIQVLALNATLKRKRLAGMNQREIASAFLKSGLTFDRPRIDPVGHEEWWSACEGPSSLIVRFNDRGSLLSVISTVDSSDAFRATS